MSWLEIVHDKSRAVLDEKTSAERAVDGKVDLGGARMNVRCVHATGTEKTDRHGHAVADKGGKICGGRSDGVATCAFCLSCRLVQEIEDELRDVA